MVRVGMITQAEADEARVADFSTIVASPRPALQILNNAIVEVDYQLTNRTTVGVLLSGFESKWSLDALTSTQVSTESRGLLWAHRG